MESYITGSGYDVLGDIAPESFPHPFIIVWFENVDNSSMKHQIILNMQQ